MKIILIFLMLIMLIGCSITPSQYKVALDACDNNGGLEFVRKSDLGATLFVQCRNGAQFYGLEYP
jgi:hypothetical protein